MDKVYEKVVNEDGQDYEIKVYYQLGGMNYFTGEIEKRGYYLSVTPITISRLGDGIVSRSFTAFSGTKVLLLEVGRKSKNRAEVARRLGEKREQELLDYVIAKRAS